jgi:hypothetical protein
MAGLMAEFTSAQLHESHVELRVISESLGKTSDSREALNNCLSSSLHAPRHHLFPSPYVLSSPI